MSDLIISCCSTPFVQQEVALGTWTSYQGCQSLSLPPDPKQVSVLIELQQSEGLVQTEMTETLVQRVHVGF